MKFQSLVTVLTSLLLVTPSSADGISCPSCSFDYDVGRCSGCRSVYGRRPLFPSHMRILSVEGGEPDDSVVLDDNVFAQFPRLESLSLSLMNISRIDPCALCSSPRLRSVALENVTLERLPPDLLASSSDLREFSATGCRLTDVPQQLFAGNAYLRTVDLSDNELTYLPLGIFVTNRHLQKVSLAGNRLTSPPLGMFDGIPPLEVLWMTSVVEGLLGIAREYPALSLERNPLICDCRLQSDFFMLERQRGLTVSLPEDCANEMFGPDCTLPVYSSSSPVVVTASLYLGVVGWTIWWQVAKGLLDR